MNYKNIKVEKRENYAIIEIANNKNNSLDQKTLTEIGEAAKDLNKLKEITKFCFENNIKIVPQGGNTSLTGASVPTVALPGAAAAFLDACIATADGGAHTAPCEHHRAVPVADDALLRLSVGERVRVLVPGLVPGRGFSAATHGGKTGTIVEELGVVGLC